MTSRHAHKRPLIQRIPYTLLLLLSILEAITLWITISCSWLTGTPQWLISLAFIAATIVIPLAMLHVATGGEAL